MNAKKLFKDVVFNLKNNHQINSLQIDSRKVCNNDCYYCIKGSVHDGSKFIAEAVQNGAKTIVSDHFIDLKDNDVNMIYVDNVRLRLAKDLKKLFSKYLKKVKIVGVTGTNGKTTITSLVYRYIRSLNIGCTLIGTNGNYINETYYETNNTTDDICTIYELIKKSVEQNIKYIIMEISSHSIKQLRIKGIEFDLSLFTNLTLDHLDFHKTMDDYMYTKLMFLLNSKKVILNSDDDCFKTYQLYLNNYVTYGFSGKEFQIIDYSLSKNKTIVRIQNEGRIIKIDSNLLGLFNVYNLTSFISIIKCLDLYNDETIKIFFRRNQIIDGRMEYLDINKRSIYIDFAHTPDGVQNVLEFLLKVKAKKLIVVIGCGGSRDTKKRRLIGDITTRLADFVIFTSDNPRDEDPSIIIDEIVQGCHRDNFVKICDRKEAIIKAFEESEEEDIIAILGKGNETYIYKGNEKIPYNDKEYVNSLFRK